MPGYMFNNSALYVTGAMALSQSAYLSWGSALNSDTSVGFFQNNNGTLMFKDHSTGSWTELGNTRDNTQLGDASSDVITAHGQLTASVGGYFADKVHVAGNVSPSADNTHDLGSASKRWANLYTADLHLKNERGDWTIVEEENYICVVNNKTKKKYKMMLEEVEE